MSSSVHPPTGRTVPRLTAQERAALTAVAVGYTQEAAAQRLGISVGWLKKALRSATARLGAVSTTHAAVLAVLDGQLDAAAIWGRVVSPWPGDGGEAAMLARFERARIARAAEAVERYSRFERLLKQGVSPAEAGVRLGLAKRTAQKYEQRFERRRLEATARDEGAHAAGP